MVHSTHYHLRNFNIPNLQNKTNPMHPKLECSFYNNLSKQRLGVLAK